jgi:elongation factor Tu
MEGDTSEMGEGAIMKLADALDSYIPEPKRALDGPFLMPVEDVFSISGRGTVVTGRAERGVHQGGRRDRDRGTETHDEDGVHGCGDVQEAAGPGSGRGQHRGLLRGTKREEVERGQVLAKPGSITPHTKFTAEIYVLEQGRGWASHAVLQRLPAAVLLPDHGRDGSSSCRRAPRW